MKLDLGKLSTVDAHHLLVSVIMPRPLAWVSTISDQGVCNLAPFSFFQGVSVKPPILSLGIGSTREGQKKDTLRNIEAVGEFVVNLVEESQLAAMNRTAEQFPYGVDEFAMTGLTPVKSELVKPPRVASSPVNFECRVRSVQYFYQDQHFSSQVLGDILLIHAREELILDGDLDANKLKVIGKLWGDKYCRLTDILEMARPK